MKRRRLQIGFVLAMVMVSMVACGFSVSTANIKDARMALDYDGNNPSTLFTGEDTFYCVAELANAPDDTKVKAAWTVVQAEGVDPDTFIDETELVTGSGTLHFELSNQNLWPPGTYKVDLYLNDKLDQTLEFEVQ